MSVVRLNKEYKGHKAGEKIKLPTEEAKRLEQEGIGDIEVETMQGNSELNEETKAISKSKTK